jgi:hypothetical protein
VKTKPCKYKVKIWCLANAKYIFVEKMKMYCGVGHEDVEHTTKYKIVYEFMNEYKNKNHIVTYNHSFFNPT